MSCSGQTPRDGRLLIKAAAVWHHVPDDGGRNLVNMSTRGANARGRTSRSETAFSVCNSLRISAHFRSLLGHFQAFIQQAGSQICWTTHNGMLISRSFSRLAAGDQRLHSRWPNKLQGNCSGGRIAKTLAQNAPTWSTTKIMWSENNRVPQFVNFGNASIFFLFFIFCFQIYVKSCSGRPITSDYIRLLSETGIRRLASRRCHSQFRRRKRSQDRLAVKRPELDAYSTRVARVNSSRIYY